MKRSGFKKVYLFLSSAVIFLVHLPFLFAKAKPYTSTAAATGAEAVNHIILTDTTVTEESPTINPAKKNLYDSLRLGSLGLAHQAYDYAMQGFNYLVETGKLTNKAIISIIDFTKPSSQKRLFVLDLDNYRILFNTYVAHGVNSGREFASQFSNTPESNKSSLGFYITSNTYYGSNGYSLRLNGLERGINDNAGSRDIVMHGADYVNEAYIHSQGYIGRSWGCPAIAPKLSKPVINSIKNGTCLFIYSNANNYPRRSRVINHG
jgi:L,D-transpeptidase catalytic domain